MLFFMLLVVLQVYIRKCAVPTSYVLMCSEVFVWMSEMWCMCSSNV